MPYINEGSRDVLENNIDSLVSSIIVDSYKHQAPIAGYMNYTISTLIMKAYQLKHGEGLRYAQINDIIGVLECVKQELYRRSFGPYEDEAMEKNGDLKEFEKWKV